MEPSFSDTAGRKGGPSDCGRPDLAQRLASGEEITGVFGSEIVAHAATCSPCSVRLSLLQQAERWLAEQATSNRGQVASETPCPSAEELFDFGRGPGARELVLGVERRVEAHLVECEECRALVATLASRPPAPLLSRAAADFSDRQEPRSRPHLPDARPDAAVAQPNKAVSAPKVRRPIVRRRWLELAAAAAVIVGAFYWWDSTRTSHGRESPALARNDAGARGSITFPTAQLLRGDSSSALCFPRTLVLAATPAGAGGTWHPLRFVIAAHPRAEMYRVELARAPASAFGRGEVLETLESPLAEFEASSALGAKLAPGDYTWEAWVRVNGLEQSLGRRDFEIVESPAAREAVAQREALPEPDRSSAILLWLVDNGFATDARAYASGLAPSPERDQFLATVPGR